MFNSFWLFFTKSTQVTILYFYFVKKSVCSQYSMDNSILKPAKVCVFCMLCTMKVNIFPLNIILFRMFSHFCSADICTVFIFKTLYISFEPFLDLRKRPMLNGINGRRFFSCTFTPVECSHFFYRKCYTIKLQEHWS